MAARTNARLQEGAGADGGALLRRHRAAWRASCCPSWPRALGSRFDVLVDTIIAVFDGEVVHRFVLAKPKLEEERLELLLGVTRLLIAKK